MQNSSRSEGVALRPFSGVDEVAKCLKDTLTLNVIANTGSFTLEPDQWLPVASENVNSLGLAISFGDLAKLRSVVLPLVLDIEDVDMLVVAMDRPASPLRESAVLTRSKFSELTPRLLLNEFGSKPASRILDNGNAGFVLELALVQNKDIPATVSTRPRTSGALIAKAQFTVKPAPGGESFQPEVLTDFERARIGLSKDALMYFEPLPGILDSKNFRQAAKFFVHESILRDVRFLPKELVYLAETYLFDFFISSLVYSVSNCLLAETEADLEAFQESAVFQLISSKNKDIAPEDIPEMLMESPSKIIAGWQGDKRSSKQLLETLTALRGVQGDLSDSDN